MLKTAFPLNQDNNPSTFPYPLTAPYINAETNVLFEGYGAATPEGAKRAVDVILGRAVMPDRSFEDQFMAASRAVKDTLYGGYDRDGDGSEDFQGLTGSNLRAADATSHELRAQGPRASAPRASRRRSRCPSTRLGRTA